MQHVTTTSKGMTVTKICEVIASVIGEYIDRDPATVEQKALIEKDLGVDAFLKAEIFSELENRLEVNLDDAAFHTSTTPIKLAHAIFDALRREDREDALQIFREGYHEVCQLPVTNIVLGKSLYFDLGLDSISMMEIAEAIEERYCLSINIQEFCRREKVDNVVNYLKLLIKNA